MSAGLAIDAALALVLPVLAWAVVATPDLRKAIVLFMALGLVAALAWARLAAPDIALVEAAIGTGVTGALLMSCVPWAESLTPASRRARADLALAGALAVVACLGWAIRALPEAGPGLTPAVLGALEVSGVEHPVTAVLLNYRSYDTLLEIVVLVAAAIGIDAVLPDDDARRRLAPPARSLVGVLSHLLVPGAVLVAGFLVWKGAHAPGGAFQAGAVLAAGGILLLFARRLRPVPFAARALRGALLAGPLLFLGVAVAPLVRGGRLLELPVAWAGVLILAIETVLVVTIAIVLLMFFPARVLASSRAPAATVEDPP